MNFSYEELSNGQYRLTEDYLHELDFRVVSYISNGWATVLPSRLLILKGNCEDKRGYVWDGATFCPRFLDRWLLRASAVHDGLTQLINKGLLSYHPYRRYADQELVKIAVEDGLNKYFAELLYRLVRAYSLIKR